MLDLQSNQREPMDKTFNLSQEQIAFIVDAIDMFEGYGDYVSSDGKYKLAEDEVDATISMFSEELK